MSDVFLRTQIEIGAPAARVWDVLTDFPAYPAWNPFILEVHGTVKAGSTIRFRFEFLQGVRIWTDALVLRFDPPRELCWEAHFLTRGLFNGEHSFSITPIDESSVVFHHLETFTGIGVPLLAFLLESRGPTKYQSLNTALKRRVEAQKTT